MERRPRKLRTMNIEQQIRQHLRASMIGENKELTSLLRVVLGEFSREGKDLDDEQAIKVIRRMHQNAIMLNNTFEEIELGRYLPKMLEPKDIKVIIENIIEVNEISSMKEMGKIMSELNKCKETHLIDKKVASEIIKTILS